MKKTVRVVARVIAFPDRVEDVKAILLNLVQITREEEGCVKYELLQNLSSPTDFTFIEEWSTTNSLSNHLASQHIDIATRLLDGLIVTQPDIRLYDLII